MSIVNWFVNNYQTILIVIGAFATISTITPNKSDDKIVDWILKIVNFLGANVGKSVNAENE